MGRSGLVSILVLAAIVGCGRLASEDAPPRQIGMGRTGERPALMDDLWDDGRAEVAKYDAREARYGILRDGEAILVTVKEDLDADTLVKADGPRHPEVVTAMKLNAIVTVPAGVYTYRQMSSAWLLRETSWPVKLVVGSQEWCGITHKVLTIRGFEGAMRGSSYFGAEGDRAYTIDVDDDTVVFDSLPLWLRTLDFDDERARTVRLIESELSNRVHAPVIAEARISPGAPVTVDVPAGSFEAVPVTVERGERRDVFFVERAAPHTLVRWDRADGGRWSLRWVRRAAYWEMNEPRFEGAFDQGT